MDTVFSTVCEFILKHFTFAFYRVCCEGSTLLKFLWTQISVEFTGKNFVVNSAKSKKFIQNAMLESLCPKHLYVQNFTAVTPSMRVKYDYRLNSSGYSQ
jgi:hypothetical protein